MMVTRTKVLVLLATLLLQTELPMLAALFPKTNKLECKLNQNGTLCIIDVPVQSRGALSLTFPNGDIHFTGNITVTSTNGGLSVEAGGEVMFDERVQVSVRDTLRISAAKMEMFTGSSLKSEGSVELGFKPNGLSSMVDDFDKGVFIHGSGTQVSGTTITLNHDSGLLLVSESAALVAKSTSSWGQLGLVMQARAIRVASSVTINAAQVTVGAHEDIFFEPTLVSGPPVNQNDNSHDPNPLKSFRAFAGGHLTLGSMHGSWKFDERFIAAAKGSINVAAGQNLQVMSNSCANQASSRHNRCEDVLHNFPEGTDEPAGDSAEMIQTIASDAEIHFDFLLASKDSVVFESSSRAIAPSIFVCAATQGRIGANVIIQSSSLGCDAGQGEGHGSSNSSASDCAGGGSHIGLGGNGVQYDSVAARHCADPGPRCDMSNVFLPTQSASGGGCGSRDKDGCKLGIYSRGGGLIWIDCEKLSFDSGAQLDSDGNKGKILSDGVAVSGGGAGGQILVWTGIISIPPESKATFSANGGDAMCSSSMAGGSGGGGFVGLGLHDRPSSVLDGLTVAIGAGVISSDCVKSKFPDAGQGLVLGNSGMASSLNACNAGHSGLKCEECPVGRWNSEGGSICRACTNRPDRAQYTKVGVTSANCPYRCLVGVPSVFGNPECLSVGEFMLRFFGGTDGLLVILFCIVFVIILLLWRRSRRKRAMSAGFGASFHGTAGTLRNIIRHRVFRRTSQQSSDGNRNLRFTNDKLPFHVCRIFLSGSNTSERPWAFDDEIPTNLSNMIMPDPWARFVADLNSAAAVPRKQRLWERCVGFFYPPAALLYSLKCRRHRGVELRRITCAFSEGTDHSHASVWKPIRARRQSASGTSAVLGMTFGCDKGATLGHIDFFDFERNQLDFAPIDLRQEVRVCVAHGDGSYAEPFALDPADPLLQHLGDMGFGECAPGCKEIVYRIVATFNWNARQLGTKELEDSGISCSPALDTLRESVESCASRCGVAGLVRVIVTSQHRSPHKQRRGQNSVGQGVDQSFSDLVRSRAAADSGAASAQRKSEGRSPFLPQGQGHGPDLDMSNSQTPPQAIPKSTYAKICLVFTENESNHLRIQSGESCHSVTSTLAAPHRSKSLTSPMPRPIYERHLDFNRHQIAVAQSEALGKQPLWRNCAHRVSSWALAARFSNQRGNSLATQAVLVILITVLVADFMMFILMGSLLWRFSVYMFALWLLLPPLTQPLAILLGPIMLLTDNARLARMYTLMIAFGITNAVITMLVLLIVNTDSWPFHILECLTVCGVKAILLLSVNAHITSLESAYDLGFVGTQQADAVCGILSAEDLTITMESRTQRNRRRVSSDDCILPGDGPDSPSSRRRKFRTSGSSQPFEWEEVDRGSHPQSILSYASEREHRQFAGSPGKEDQQPRAGSKEAVNTASVPSQSLASPF